MKINYSDKLNVPVEEAFWQAFNFLLIQEKNFPKRKVKKATGYTKEGEVNLCIEFRDE